MGTGYQTHPEADAWIAAIHATEDDFTPAGSGIVLDELRILTCHHVIKNLADRWISFPKAQGKASQARRRVSRVIPPDGHGDIRDVAILVLAEPVPAGVTAAPLSFPEPTGLVGNRWWAFGFPSDSLGSSAGGHVSAALAHGWVRLLRESADPIERGFSGGGLWCPEYQGVVGIVGQVDGEPGGGRAITLDQADQAFPGQNLRALAAPEVVELARSLAGRPDALSIIHEVLDRTPAVAPLGATIVQLLAWMHELVQPSGEDSLLQQVSELAEQRASTPAQAASAQEDASDDPPAGDPCLLIAIEPSPFDEKSFSLSVTLFSAGPRGKPQEVGSPFGSLPELRKLVRTMLPPILDARRDMPLIEFAVPARLLGEDFDQWPMQGRPDGPPAEDYRVGDRYPVVVRDLDRMDPAYGSVKGRYMWESRWRLLLAGEGSPQGLMHEVELQRMADLRAAAAFSWLRDALWGATGNAVLVLLPPSLLPASARGARPGKAITESLRAGFDAGMPAAIWLRHPFPRKHHATSASVRRDEDDRSYLVKVLDQAARGPSRLLRDLPRLVWSLRLEARLSQGPGSHPGQRLSLLWADPGRSWTPTVYQLPARSSNGEDV
jgi:vWA-MoxR associated protein C-terminal domain/Trypsin-like peptidase domain